MHLHGESLTFPGETLNLVLGIVEIGKVDIHIKIVVFAWGVIEIRMELFEFAWGII